ncbi:MAG: hypothetical protein KDH89_10125, partial [Anaerolineae bacterium]|nr:hypothetical protein [Anaerolineae bacterium]
TIITEGIGRVNSHSQNSLKKRLTQPYRYDKLGAASQRGVVSYEGGQERVWQRNYHERFLHQLPFPGMEWWTRFRFSGEARPLTVYLT